MTISLGRRKVGVMICSAVPAVSSTISMVVKHSLRWPKSGIYTHLSSRPCQPL